MRTSELINKVAGSGMLTLAAAFLTLFHAAIGARAVT